MIPIDQTSRAGDSEEPEAVDRFDPESDKMAALSRVAGTIAHDINNYLTIIAGYGQMLRDAVATQQPEEKLQVYIGELLSAGSRAAELTDKLLTFGGRKSVRMKRIDLRPVVQEAQRTIQNVAGPEIEVRVDLDREPCWVWGDAGQLTEVLMQLAANAAEAMPGGGTLTIRAELAGDSVLLEMRDTGVGMDAATQAAMFEPFTTIKPKRLGVGLGLSMVFGLVKLAGGEIAVESEPGAGTVFGIAFPFCTDAEALRKGGKPRVLQGVPGQKQSGADSAAMIGTETILLVEDDEPVRVLVQAMLSRYGYKALAADGGKAAMNLFESHAASIDMVLTDVMMPEMSGRELAVELRQMDPSVRILYMSGYTAGEIAEHLDAKPLLIQKPFSAEGLARRVREVLDAPR